MQNWIPITILIDIISSSIITKFQTLVLWQPYNPLRHTAIQAQLTEKQKYTSAHT